MYETHSCFYPVLRIIHDLSDELCRCTRSGERLLISREKEAVCSPNVFVFYNGVSSLYLNTNVLLEQKILVGSLPTHALCAFETFYGRQRFARFSARLVPHEKEADGSLISFEAPGRPCPRTRELPHSTMSRRHSLMSLDAPRRPKEVFCTRRSRALAATCSTTASSFFVPEHRCMS